MVDAIEVPQVHVVGGLLSDELCSTAYSYVRLKAEIGQMQLGDGHVQDAFASYGDVLMEVLLQRVQPRVEEVTATSLLPTYSYVRLYRHGQQMTRHRDRPACEFTVTVTLGAERSEPWPIFVASPLGVERIVAEPGDGLIYPGADFDHWREPFEGEWQAQLTAHYVDRDGPHASWAYDKRPGLGRQFSIRRA
jgi:hypothetical protein